MPFANFKQLMGGNATLGQSLRRFPQYTGVTTGGMMNHSGNSTYNAMILKANSERALEDEPEAPAPEAGAGKQD